MVDSHGVSLWNRIYLSPSPGSRGSAVWHPPRVRELFYLLLLDLVGRRCVIRHESGDSSTFSSWNLVGRQCVIRHESGNSFTFSSWNLVGRRCIIRHESGNLPVSFSWISWVGGVSSATSPGTLLLSGTSSVTSDDLVPIF